MEMNVQIKNFQQLENDPRALASFDVYVPEYRITLNRWKIVRKKDGSAVFVSEPSYPEENSTGFKTWKDYVVFDEPMHKFLKDAVFRAVKPMLDRSPDPLPF